MRALQIFLFPFVFLSLIGQAQDPVYAVDQIKDDFKLFRQALEESHPGLYRYRTKQEMTKRFDDGYAALTKPMTELEFYKVLTPIISALGCGHTSVRLSEKFYASHSIQQSFPFDVRIMDGKAFIVKIHNSDPDIVPGSQLLSVDGHPVQSMIASILPNLNGDGFVMTSRYKTLEQNFSRLFRLYIREADSYVVMIRTKSGREVEKKVAMIPASSIKQPQAGPGLEFKIVNDKLAVMVIRSFMSGVSGVNGIGYEDFLLNSFNDLKKRRIQNLVIDVRGNGGGRDDYGALLFAYLTDKSFMYYSYLEMNKPTLSFLKHTGRPESFKKELEGELTKTADGRYLYKEFAHPCLPLQPSQAAHFDKNVYVLIDGKSFSATAEFASITRFKKRAVFVGEETGGAYEGNTSGGGVDVILPGTKIKVVIPLTKYVCAVEPDPKPKGRGIIPDIEIKPTLDAILSGKDEGMEKILEIINK